MGQIIEFPKQKQVRKQEPATRFRSKPKVVEIVFSAVATTFLLFTLALIFSASAILGTMLLYREQASESEKETQRHVL